MKTMTILVLGAGIMQIPALETARRNGWRLIVADGNPDAPGRHLADAFHAVDLSDEEGLLKLARDYRNHGQLDGVFTAGTDFSTSVAYVAESLGLPGLDYESARNARDKFRMRRVLREAGVPAPAFVEVQGVVDLRADSLPTFPLVVKPVDNMGARGVRRVDTPAELEEAVPEALRFSRSGRVVVEEFISGPEFSIDALVVDGTLHLCGIADRHIRFPPYFIEVGHTMPTERSEADQQRIAGVLEAAAQALGIRNGAAKGDIFLTDNGPMVGEVAARLSGGYMSGWTYPYSSGVEPTEGAMRIALGLDPGDLTPRRRWTAAERASVSIPGVVAEVRGIDSVQKMGAIRDLFERVGPGDEVVFPRNNTEKAANVIAAAPEREEAVRAAEGGIARIIVRLEPNRDETAAFLDEPTGPQALKLHDERNRRALSVMPEDIANAGVRAYHPLPAPEAETSPDWNYRTLSDTLSILSSLTGLRPARRGEAGYGRRFWRRLLKGGLQGALFHLDTLNEDRRDRRDGTE